MDNILVSIDCITYNHEKYIAEAIESFLMQKTNFNFEILIHDDASTDKTADIIKSYESKYPDIIKPIFEKENQYSKGVKNINYIYNYCRAKGKYVAICEGDDYWTDPYKLQTQVKYMESHDKCGMCFHAANIVKGGRIINKIRPYSKNCISSTEDIIVGDGSFMATNSILYRKQTMNNVPNFCHNCPVGDYPLQILTSTKKYAYYIDKIMSTYRTGVEGSWTSSMILNDNKHQKVIQLHKDIIDMLREFDKYTERKYSEAVIKRILNSEFEIVRLNHSIKDLKEPRFQDIYDSLDLNSKIKLHLNAYLPNIYEKMAKMKKYIIEKKM